VLPARKKVAPNDGSGWELTQKVMGTHVKSKRQSKHTDPFSGGEQSGRKGQPDVRQPPAPIVLAPPPPAQSEIPQIIHPVNPSPDLRTPYPHMPPPYYSSWALPLSSPGPSTFPSPTVVYPNPAPSDQLHYRTYDFPHSVAPDAAARHSYYH
jgi:hypothetical protein